MEDIREKAVNTAQKLASLMQAGNIELAKIELDKFKKIAGNSYFSHYLSANFNAGTNQWEQAAKDSMNALEFNGQDGEMWNTLGVALCNCQEYDEGLVCIHKAYQLNQGGAAENFNYWKSYFITINKAANHALSLFISEYDEEDRDSVVRIKDINEQLIKEGSTKMDLDNEPFLEPILYKYMQKEMPELRLSILQVPPSGSSFISIRKEIALYPKAHITTLNSIYARYLNKEFKTI